MFGWSQWDKNLLHFKGKPIKILEIGVYKGQAMEKFAQVFLEANKDAEYYGLDTWEGSPEYVEIDFKEIEKQAIERRERSKANSRIHFIKKMSTDGLIELINKKIFFDIIFIDASHVAKDVLTDAVMAIKILNIDGIIIFDDYLWNKLKPDIFTPKPAIDSFLYIFSDELNLLYKGYQLICKRVKPKFKELKQDKTIIEGLLTLIDNYWKNYDVKKHEILFHLDKLPKLNAKFNKSDLILRMVPDIELFFNLSLDRYLFKYIDLTDLKNEFTKIKHDTMIKKLLEIAHVSHYSVYNLILEKKLFNPTEGNKLITYLSESKIEQESVYYSIVSEEENKKKNQIYYLSVYDIENAININTLDYKNIFKQLREKKIKVNNYGGVNLFRRAEYLRRNNNLLLQFLICSKVLNQGGTFTILIGERYDFINDFITLLTYAFKKLEIYIFSNKIGRLNIHLICKGFIGIPDKLFNELYKILEESKEKDLVSIFTECQMCINFDSIQLALFESTKKIINVLKEHGEIIKKNVKELENNIIKRTLDDIYEYLL